MAVIVLDPNQYVFFDSSYRSLFLSEDSGGDVLYYDRKNLFDSSAFYFDSSYRSLFLSEDSGGDVLYYDRKNLFDSSAFYFNNNYDLFLKNDESIVKVALGEPAIKERWGR
jgi:hypothetical protein